MGNSFYTAASMLIAVPSGIQVFCWIATIGTGKPRLAVPLLYVLGFFALFVLGGMTGVMVASVPLDLQVHDTYFVVAHFHYVLIGGAVFPLFGALYMWFPKFTGRALSERLGKWQFWILFAGFNVTFFPMHYLGLIGMPRRVYTYQTGLGWDLWNLVSTLGAYLIALSILLFAFNVVRALRQPVQSDDDPWGAPDLAWATSSPPPSYGFEHVHVVHDREPLWSGPDGTPRTEVPVFHGLRSDRREALLTSPVDAVPVCRWAMPDPTVWPLIGALTLTVAFIWSIFDAWGVVWGAIPVGIALTIWFWPKKSEPSLESTE
jgi:cytochrome c oxidase subunit 1